MAALGLAAPVAFAQQVVPGWALCGNSFQMPAKPPLESAIGAPDQVQMAADSADISEQGESVFTGNVQIYQKGLQAHADKVIYNRDSEIAEGFGNVRFWAYDDWYLEGDHGRVDLAGDVTSADQADYLIWPAHGHGSADNLTLLDDKRLLRGRNVTYSTCNAGDETWVVNATEMELDREEEWGAAKDVVVEFGGVPVFYSPFLSFPLSDRRKSGFLAPGFGQSSGTGYEFIMPYYWNIAPERDATLAVRGMSKRGVMLMGEYRYITDEDAKGLLEAEILPHDTSRGGTRALVHFKHSGTIRSGWSSNINYNQVTDKDYFNDFGTRLDVTASQFLERRGDLYYSGYDWSVLGRLQNFQTIDPTIPGPSRPYERLPQIRATYDPVEINRRFNPYLRAEYVRFDRDSSVTGHRVDLMPRVSFPLRTPGAYLVPTAELRYTRYELDNTPATLDANADRLLPSGNIDAGLFFDRDFSLFNSPYTQTLEPRLFYLYRPFEDQSDISVFDTGLYSFNFAQLFRTDRFTGADRLGDANQVTLALSSRVLDPKSGEELLRASVGQIRYFRDRRVTLPGRTVARDNESDIVAEVSARLAGAWRIDGGLQWNVDEDRTDKSAISLRYKPDSQRVVNFAYRFVRDVVETGDVSARWPFGRNWAAVGRVNYSIPDKRLIDTFGGVEYNSCCWAFRVVGRRFLNLDGGQVEPAHSTGVYMEIELKGLAGVGNSAGSFLKTAIPGYEKQF